MSDPTREALREAVDWITSHEDAIGHSYCDLNVGDGWASEACTCGLDAKLDRWRAISTTPAPLDVRPELIAWFHESDEICEHEYPNDRDWPCGIMADHLLRAFEVAPRLTEKDGAFSFEGDHFHRLRLAASLFGAPDDE